MLQTILWMQSFILKVIGRSSNVTIVREWPSICLRLGFIPTCLDRGYGFAMVVYFNSWQAQAKLWKVLALFCLASIKKPFHVVPVLSPFSDHASLPGCGLAVWGMLGTVQIIWIYFDQELGLLWLSLLTNFTKKWRPELWNYIYTLHFSLNSGSTTCFWEQSFALVLLLVDSRMVVED